MGRRQRGTPSILTPAKLEGVLVAQIVRSLSHPIKRIAVPDLQ
jgi:hypothetical protein